MDYRSHEFPQHASNDPRQLINRAMTEGYLVYFKYCDLKGNQTKRIVKPSEWVDNDKIQAFCYETSQERLFVLSDISEICLVANSGEEIRLDTKLARHSAPHVSVLQQRSVKSILSAETHAVSQKQTSQSRLYRFFSRVRSWICKISGLCGASTNDEKTFHNRTRS